MPTVNVEAGIFISDEDFAFPSHASLDAEKVYVGEGCGH